MTLNNNSNEYVSFTMGGMHFEYDEKNSDIEDRYDTIGDFLQEL